MTLVSQLKYSLPILLVDTWEERGIPHGFLAKQLDVSEGSKSFEEKFNSKLHLLNQTHGTEIAEVIDPLEHSESISADAWIVKVLKGQKSCFGIKTADCVPILINTHDDSYRAAVHCGWRGAVDGLLVKVIRRLFALGVRPENLNLAFGPSASVCKYQVGLDVVERVNQAHESCKIANYQPIIQKSEEYFADVKALLISQVISEGLLESQIVSSPNCTIDDENYFSYRRKKSELGRQLSFISN